MEEQNKKTKKTAKLNVMSYEQFTVAFDNILSTFLNISSLNTKDYQLSDLKLKRILLDDIIDKIVINNVDNGEILSIYLKIPNISTTHNFEILQTCPIHNILSI